MCAFSHTVKSDFMCLATSPKLSHDTYVRWDDVSCLYIGNWFCSISSSSPLPENPVFVLTGSDRLNLERVGDFSYLWWEHLAVAVLSSTREQTRWRQCGLDPRRSWQPTGSPDTRKTLCFHGWANRSNNRVRKQKTIVRQCIFCLIRIICHRKKSDCLTILEHRSFWCNKK